MKKEEDKKGEGAKVTRCTSESDSRFQSDCGKLCLPSDRVVCLKALGVR